MNILKVLCHIEADRMLYSALGDQLTILRMRDHTGWIPDEDLGFPVTHDYATVSSTDWDWIIFDDIRTWESLRDFTTKNKLWYVHGTYHTWGEFQFFANRSIHEGFHFLFTDADRLAHWDTWFTGTPVSELTLPIHLSDRYYSEASPYRNSKVCMVGSEIIRISKLYDSTGIAEEVMSELFTLNSDTFHMFGYNGGDFFTPEEFKKGNAFPIRDTLGNYSCSVHASQVKTLGFALVECMAAGIPVICSPKVDLPEDLGNGSWAYLIAHTPDEYMHYVRMFLADPMLSYSVGRKGQSFLRERFSFESYKKKLNTFLNR